MFVLLAALIVASSSAQEPPARRVERAVAAPLRDRRFAGAVLVEKDGRVLVRKAYCLVRPHPE
jgi:hypothetical protein